MRAGSSRVSGFSLLELLVVILLLGITAVVAIPQFGESTHQAQLRSAGRNLVALLRRERSIAIATQQPSAVSIDVVAGRAQSMDGKAFTRIQPALAIKLVGAKVETGPSGVVNIRFYPDGSSTGGRISLQGDERHLVIDVDWFTGRVQVLQP